MKVYVHMTDFGRRDIVQLEDVYSSLEALLIAVPDAQDGTGNVDFGPKYWANVYFEKELL